MMDPKVFGGFIQSRRKLLQMNQAQLAEKLQVTAKAVSRWERGVGFPGIELLEPLAEALEVSLVELMRSRLMEDTLSGEEVAQIVTDTIESIRKQEKKQRRKIYFLFLLLPVLFGAQSFLFLIYYRVKDGFLPGWARFLFYEIIFLMGILGSRALYYIIQNEYEKLKDKGKTKKGILLCSIVSLPLCILLLGIAAWWAGEMAAAVFCGILAGIFFLAFYLYFFLGREKEE